MCTQVKSCLFVLCKQSDRVCAQLLYCKVGRTITISTGGLFVCLCLHTNEQLNICTVTAFIRCPSIRFSCSFLNSFLHQSSLFMKIIFFSFYERYSTLLHPPPLRFHCVGGVYLSEAQNLTPPPLHGVH
jgi:hypothetical protein